MGGTRKIQLCDSDARTRAQRRFKAYGQVKPMNKSFCFFFQKEDLFFFEKKNQKTFIRNPSGRHR
jgi:hypothetical protein